MNAQPLGTTYAPFGYYVHVPMRNVAYEQSGYPLLLFFHGLPEGGNGSSQLPRLLKHGPPRLLHERRWREATRHPFVVLAPQSATGYPGTDEVEAFVSYALEAYPIDPERIYLTGLSAGAGTVWGYLAAQPERGAAAFIISGRGARVAASAAHFSSVPLWVFHGARDRRIPLAESLTPVGACNALRSAETRVRLTVFPEVGHVAWSGVYDLAWMRSGLSDPRHHPFDESPYDWLMRWRAPPGRGCAKLPPRP